MNNMNNDQNQYATVVAPQPKTPLFGRPISPKMKMTMLYITGSVIFAAFIIAVLSFYFGVTGISFFNILPDLVECIEDVDSAYATFVAAIICRLIGLLFYFVFYVVLFIISIVVTIKAIRTFIDFIKQKDLTLKRKAMYQLLKFFSSFSSKMILMLVIGANFIPGDDIEGSAETFVIMVLVVYFIVSMLRRFSRDTFHSVLHLVTEGLRDIFMLTIIGTLINNYGDIDAYYTIFTGGFFEGELFDFATCVRCTLPFHSSGADLVQLRNQ